MGGFIFIIICIVFFSIFSKIFRAIQSSSAQMKRQEAEFERSLVSDLRHETEIAAQNAPAIERQIVVEPPKFVPTAALPASTPNQAMMPASTPLLSADPVASPAPSILDSMPRSILDAPAQPTSPQAAAALTPAWFEQRMEEAGLLQFSSAEDVALPGVEWKARLLRMKNFKKVLVLPAPLPPETLEKYLTAYDYILLAGTQGRGQILRRFENFLGDQLFRP